MERDTLIASIATGAAVVSIGLAIGGHVLINKMNSTVNFDTSVKVAQAGSDTTAVETDEDGNSVETTDGTAAETEDTSESSTTATNLTGTVNIQLIDGAIQVTDTVLKVPAESSSNEDDTAHDIYVYLSGTNEIKYDSTSTYLELNGSTVVRTINAVDATYEGISQFMDSDGQQVLIGEKLIDDTSAIAVVHTIPASGDGAEIDLASETEVVQNILDNTYADVTVTDATLFGYSINPEWVEDMIVTGKGLELIKGDSAIYVAPYTGTFAQGTTNTLKAGSISLTYSDSIKDDSTGYKPYILKFTSTQEGSSSKETLQAKILATSNLDVKDLFLAN